MAREVGSPAAVAPVARAAAVRTWAGLRTCSQTAAPSGAPRTRPPRTQPRLQSASRSFLPLAGGARSSASTQVSRERRGSRVVITRRQRPQTCHVELRHALHHAILRPRGTDVCTAQRETGRKAWSVSTTTTHPPGAIGRSAAASAGAAVATRARTQEHTSSLRPCARMRGGPQRRTPQSRIPGCPRPFQRPTGPCGAAHVAVRTVRPPGASDAALHRRLSRTRPSRPRVATWPPAAAAGPAEAEPTTSKSTSLFEMTMLP